jgi:NhaP-type Na+/H+ or K+/H+ antiporter
LLLAGPGVIMGAVFMALFLYFFIPLGWNWNICMLLGSILAATDPVAVVALLKNAGASPKLTILIIGESLMNDGTAMVLFTLYYNMMEGKHYSGGGIIVFFLSTCIGSPLLGIAFGLAGVFWLGRANRPLSGDDVTIQIVITVCVAYLVFYVAQFQCEMSGVLACCGAGCVFAYLAPPLILEHETMHNVWGFMEWFANTLIFLLSGLIIGSETQTNITTIDWLYVFILYIFLLIIRCVIIWILFPALKNIGLKCSKKDAIFMAWSGLRGALGMTLSLIVYSNRDDLDMSKDDANKVFFYVGGIASLTLIINATSAQNVLNYLGLLKEDDSPEMINIIHQANRNLRMRGLEIAHKLENDKYHISMDDLMEYNSIIRNEAESECRNSKALENMRKKSYSRRERPEDVTQDTLRYCRTMFLDCVRSKYWKFIEEGKMPRQSRVTQILLYSIDNALDRVNKKGLRDWKLIRKELQMNSTLAAVTDAIRDYTPTFFPFHFLGDLLTTKNIYLRVYIITSFIDAHEDAQKQFYHFMSDLPDNDDEHNDTTGQDKVYTMEQRTVIEESIASV